MKYAMTLLVALLLAACANDVVKRSAGSSASDAADVIAFNGEQYYKDYCSGCHETGMLGAPVTGLQQDWAERSQLWDAVLFDHAITGYLQMPTKGGRTDLPDDVVKAAAEYMLRITFPERPQDCNPPACSETQE